MTARVVASRPTLGTVWAELVARQALLARYGATMMLIALPVLLAQLIDPRTIQGVNVWVKPAKFLVSVGVFAVTTAWFFGYVRPERRSAPMLRAIIAVLILAGSFELIWIGWQASQGLASHFNNDTPFFAMMYALTGVFAVLLVSTTLPLAWEIARRSAPGLTGDFAAAVVIGLLLTFLLGGGLGGYMSQQLGHSVGAEGGHVPMFGWNRGGGDLRVAHFFGIHAQQAIPILGALAAGAATHVRWAVVLGGSALYAALTIAVFVQATAGKPLLGL